MIYSTSFSGKTLLAIGLLFLHLLNCEKASASHAMGADLTYRCLGNNQYEVTYSFYRDCIGITPANPMSLDIVNGCTGAALAPVNMTLQPGYPINISPTCDNVATSCNGGSYTGIQEYVYSAIITLPSQCTDWRISHTESARNNAINTVPLASLGNLYVYSSINNTICNNSPTFTNRPVPITCVNQTFTFNHGAIDADGDSLVYSLITPLLGWGQPITYNSPLTGSQFVQSNPPIVFSTSTGDIRVTPTVTCVTVFAVLVSEYRNGVLIGQVERDIQLTVLACQNQIPALLGINGTPSYNTTTCAGQQVCFNIWSLDTNINDTTTITWNNAIPGATFVTTGTRRDSARFCWTPTLADVSTRPKCFTATVRDNYCPYRGLQVFSYCIRVNGVVAFGGPDQTIACNAVTNLVGSAILGNGVYNYQWNPGAFNNDTLYNATIGTYYLTVTSQGCSATDTVRILPGVGGSLASFTSLSNCSNRQVQFTDQSSSTGTNITSWNWDFGDGSSSTSQSPSHTYSANGTYNVQLIVNTASGCTDTVMQQVVVSQNIPVASFSAANVCQGATMNFSDQSSGSGITSWSWNFGESSSGSNTSTNQNTSHVYSQPGNYNVTLTVTNNSGCTATIINQVTVHSNPVVNLANAQICSGDQATLSVPSGFSNYNWSTGSASNSIVVSPSSTSNYSVIVTDINSCTGSASAQVTVNSLPAASAGNNQTICQGTTAILNASGGTNFVWSPGNISGQSISVTPLSTTVYTVLVTNSASCTSTASVTITVNTAPAFMINDDVQICSGSSATLSVLNGSGSFTWTPGGSTASSINVSPSASTMYYLTVTDGIGCSGRDSVLVTVHPLPVAAFTSGSPVCLNNSIAFSDNTSLSSGALSQWTWSFGDSQSSSNQNPSHVYTVDGTYTVKLIVRSAAGCADSTQNAVTVFPLPVASAGLPQNICPGQTASLTGSGGVSYSWNPGGFASSTVQVSPTTTTDYELTVTDANGCEDSDNVTVTVYPAVDASAGNDTEVCLGESVTLEASGGANYLWSPGGANSAINTFTPAVSGVYSVLVTSSDGCTGSDQVLVTVHPIPTASFTGNNSVCYGNSINLSDQSAVSSGNIATWNWDFGDGSTSGLQNPLVNYSTSGNFTIELTVTSDEGCVATYQNTQTVWASPEASFTSSNVCDGLPVDFQSTASISDGSPLVYNWVSSDGFTSSDPSFNHLFSGSGGYNMSLIVTSINGCTDAVQRQVDVYPLPVAAFSAAAVCANDPVSILDLSTVNSGFIQTWSWNLGDGSTSSSQIPVHAYTVEGNYRIELIVTTDRGCVDSNFSFLRIIPRPLVDFTGQNVCFGFPVLFANLSSPVTGTIDQYQWSFGDGGVSTDSIPAYVYARPGTFNVTLTATSDSGCTTTRTIPNAVEIFPPPRADFSDNSSEASDIYPLVNFLNLSNEPGISYWSFGDSTFSSEYSPTHQYPGVGVYDVQLVIVNNSGCVDTLLRTVEVRPTSTIFIPSAFSPNGDQKNDLFQVYSSNLKSLEVSIYDRWGLKIFEWDNSSAGWDGKINGAPAQADVYVYRIVTVDARDKKEVRLGHVYLMR